MKSFIRRADSLPRLRLIQAVGWLLLQAVSLSYGVDDPNAQFHELRREVLAERLEIDLAAISAESRRALILQWVDQNADLLEAARDLAVELSSKNSPPEIGDESWRRQAATVPEAMRQFLQERQALRDEFLKVRQETAGLSFEERGEKLRAWRAEAAQRFDHVRKLARLTATASAPLEPPVSGSPDPLTAPLPEQAGSSPNSR